MKNDDRAMPSTNRGGRPRLVRDSESIPVSTRLPERVHDKIKTIADSRGDTMARTIRRLIILNLKDQS